MRLFAPQNIFTKLLQSALPAEIESFYHPSSLIVKQLETTTNGVALIPTLDLLKHKTLFVSGKIGISFDGLLSQSFLYFVKNQKTFEKLFLRGDVSLNELILTKILFQEKYSSTPELILDTSALTDADKNYIVCGDDNYLKMDFEKGISLADEFSDLLDFPYVNYVFASPDKEALKQFETIADNIDSKIERNIESVLSNMKLSPSINSSFIANYGSVYYDLLENEHNAINELIRLVYYYGITEDMFEVKFLA